MSRRRSITAARARLGSEFEDERRPLNFGLIRRLFSHTRPYVAKRNWLFLMVVLRGIQGPCLAWALGSVIKGPITHGDVRGTIWGALGFGALAAFTQFTLHFRQRLALELGEAVVHDLRNAVYDHLLRMPMSFFHRTKLGRIISRMTSDIESIRAGVQNVFFVTLVGGLQMFFASVLMLWYEWRLFLVVAGMAPAIWILNLLFRQRYSRATRATQESFSRVTSTVAESVGGIRVTQGFVRQDVNAGVFRRLVSVHSRYNIGMARTAGVFLPLLELKSQFFVAALLVLGGWRVLESQMTIGDLIRFFFLANIFFEPLQFLGNMYNQALIAMAGAERIYKLLDSPPDWQDAEDAIELPATPSPRAGIRVEFRAVHFGYQPDRMVLHDVNFAAEPGQTVALVGPTGSGKTSIINLISKFYLPNQGEVLIDGMEIRKIKADSLHRQMGFVQQQNFLFAGTVLDNIRMGRPGATETEVREVCQRLDCWDMVAALPDGLQTLAGERGSGLSLGQRQLICFARAMIADPRILILDEATSSVDTLTEARIQKALAALLQGRTSLVVAHRLSTVRHADLVLVLEHGKIIERGTHDSLLAAGGPYARLYQQFVRTAV